MKYTKDEIDIINELTLSNDILFNIVFRDEKLLSKQFIEILESNKLNSNIELVMQSEQRVNFNKKSILDMKLLNGNNCYIVEMQQSKRDFSVKRADLIIANTFSNLVNIGMNEDDYPVIRLHVLCTYKNFDNDDFKQVVKQSVLGKEDYNYNSTIEVIYHNIASNKLPKNLYGDLCKYIYTGVLSDHKYIKYLDNKVKRVKMQEDTFMEIHESLLRSTIIRQQGFEDGTLYGEEIGKEIGKNETQQMNLRKVLKTFKKMGINKTEACKLVKDTIELPINDINVALEEIY